MGNQIMANSKIYKYIGVPLLTAMSSFPLACNSNRVNENVINWSFQRQEHTDMPNISVTGIRRPKLDDNLESWKKLYSDIRARGFPPLYEATSEETRYFERFIRKSPEKRQEIINSPGVKKLDFFDPNPHSIKDIIFLYHIQENKNLLKKVQEN